MIQKSESALKRKKTAFLRLVVIGQKQTNQKKGNQKAN